MRASAILTASPNLIRVGRTLNMTARRPFGAARIAGLGRVCGYALVIRAHAAGNGLRLALGQSADVGARLGGLGEGVARIGSVAIRTCHRQRFFWSPRSPWPFGAVLALFR
jgi:hypothetical protein